MSPVGETEFRTQERVLQFFRTALSYRYLGNRHDGNNRNVDDAVLRDWLGNRGVDSNLSGKVLSKLNRAAALGGGRDLYDANRSVYDLLRYGVKIPPPAGDRTETVRLVDWDDSGANHFAVAEEVTVAGPNPKRPDLVLYLNGIAIAVLELKRSTVSVTEGIRQNLDNQKKEFIRPFFSTIQLLLAGNETEGLRYGAIETPEKHWLRWKENGAPPPAGDNPLLREIGQLCDKERLLEIIHDFTVFDAGVRKTCRHSQYHGVKAAQERVKRREGGILWHTQGSGKSLVMVWLAQWIREQVPESRVLIVTDRTELDEQIHTVFTNAGEQVRRTQSGADLVEALRSPEDWLVCSLVHKFGASDEDDTDRYLRDFRSHLPSDFRAAGDIFVFVDECHRTQSGTLHRAMKKILPEAMLIGFTGTPLLKTDKGTSLETFGPFIHTYKYDEAVKDGVVLDLRYEARDIEQTLSSPEKVDQWFDSKTNGLTDAAKATLKKRWGTMQKVLSSRDRLQRIVEDIALDMGIRDRLKSDRGNAILVSDSIYAACRLFEMFERTELNGKCAVVTSYEPTISDIKGEETGEGLTERLRQYEIYRRMLAAHFDEPEDAAMHKVAQFEIEVKRRFVEEPARMKLLIVVDKLLTGFDAPPASVLYIDKQMQDHGLFQAICRVNRIHGDDKEYGHIVDYKDLFRSLKASVETYTGEALDGYEASDVDGLLRDRLRQARERLEAVRERIEALCEPVEPPRGTTEYIRNFCAEDTGDAEQLKANEKKRQALYRLTASFVRAYADLANDMASVGYGVAEARDIAAEVGHWEMVRGEIQLASGDLVDLKRYEPAMRHLLDTYIRAEETAVLSTFEDLTLVQLLVERGPKAIDLLPSGLRNDQTASAEAIVNNVRRLIIDERPTNPQYYERMSKLLDELVRRRKQEAVEYEEFLRQLTALAKRITAPAGEQYPTRIGTAPLRAFYDEINAIPDLEHLALGLETEEATDDLAATLAEQVDRSIRQVKKADWRGNTFKEREVRNAILGPIPRASLADRLFEIAKAQSDY